MGARAVWWQSTNRKNKKKVSLPPASLLFPSATGESTWDPGVFIIIIIILPYWRLSYYKHSLSLYLLTPQQARLSTSSFDRTNAMLPMYKQHSPLLPAARKPRLRAFDVFCSLVCSHLNNTVPSSSARLCPWKFIALTVPIHSLGVDIQVWTTRLFACCVLSMPCFFLWLHGWIPLTNTGAHAPPLSLLCPTSTETIQN